MSISNELTVVIPAKNEEKLLPRLLRSLLKQDYPLMRDTRVFVADAGSTDRTVQVANEFSRDLQISVIQGGLPAVGRNNGARCASSQYLLFIDADMEVADRTLLRRAIHLIKTRSLHCVTTDIWCRDGGWLDSLLYCGNNIVQRISRFHRPFATGMFMLVDRSAFVALGGFDEQALYAEDYQLTQRIDRSRFRVIRGGIYSTNRRFRKMGHATIVRYFLKTAIHSGQPEYFRSKMHQAYWEAY
jgi:glycosyltransferase involved in cell wall biosynthesis